jgi:hypothetical protein
MSDSEDRLARLVVARDKLAQALADDPAARDLPAISREYRMLLGAIAELDAKKETADVVDEIAARRSTKTPRRPRRSS